MRSLYLQPVALPLRQPFITAARRVDTYHAIRVRVSHGACVGEGEARGIPLHGETPDTMAEQVTALKSQIEGGLDRQSLFDLLPAGGARNALDCALWQLEARLKGQTLWQVTGIANKPLETAITLSVGTPDSMAAEAASRIDFPLLKIKMDGPGQVDCIDAIRQARPDARLIVDANQSLSHYTLPSVAGHLHRLGVLFLEQPLKKGEDHALSDMALPLPVCADESVLTRQDIKDSAGRYDMINIKLDKAGGLTEALAMVEEARRLGLGIMVGNMLGSRLALSPAFMLAQLADYADLDGPLLLAEDDTKGLTFDGPIVRATF